MWLLGHAGDEEGGFGDVSENVQSALRLQLAIDKAIADDWEQVKDAAGKTDRRSLFDMAYRFGWHEATKYWTKRRQEEHEKP